MVCVTVDALYQPTEKPNRLLKAVAPSWLTQEFHQRAVALVTSLAEGAKSGGKLRHLQCDQQEVDLDKESGYRDLVHESLVLYANLGKGGSPLPFAQGEYLVLEAVKVSDLATSLTPLRSRT